jgi:LPXTG-site transpeptidase (sortase) family protein
MRTELATKSASSTVRGLVRVLPGLALVAALAGCASNDYGDMPELLKLEIEFVTPSTTPLPAEPEDEPADQSEEPMAPEEGRAAEIKGAYQLRIPKINTSAPVVSIKMNEDRVLVPPRDPTVVGWWSEGVAPGAPTGSAVFVGHTVSSGGGVFDEVGKLGAGDTIEVESSGATLTYEVRTVDVLSKDDLARYAEEIFNQSGAGRLVIITCEDWDGSTWRSNIVTVATPI